VYVFAYAEGSEACTVSYFSTMKDRVRQGKISMYSASGELLASAQTDDQGERCFPLPETPGDLKFVIEAGQGHRAEFTLRGEDLPDPADRAGASGGEGSAAGGAADSNAPAESGAEGAGAAASAAPGGPSGAGAAQAGSGAALTAQAVRSIVREEVRAQVGPVARALAEQEAKSRLPGLREVVGGLGWILGIFGIVTLARGRKKFPPDAVEKPKD
jgi:nickel transport protein